MWFCSYIAVLNEIDEVNRVTTFNLQSLWKIVAQTAFLQFQGWLFEFYASQMYQAAFRAIPNKFHTL